MLSPRYAVIWGWCMQYPLKPVVHVMVVLNLFDIEPWDILEYSIAAMS
jgi:hypothetical protein